MHTTPPTTFLSWLCFVERENSLEHTSNQIQEAVEVMEAVEAIEVSTLKYTNTPTTLLVEF